MMGGIRLSLPAGHGLSTRPSGVPDWPAISGLTRNHSISLNCYLLLALFSPVTTHAANYYVVVNISDTNQDPQTSSHMAYELRALKST
jgi:hypothetical protein